MTAKILTDPEPVFTNRLVHEKSPYLLQHAHNPVDWYPWGEEAFEKARQEGKVIFISIGYATCHWCHVMEKESFEDAKLAEYLNEHFVSIKVDREERPDVDQIYMDALHLLQQQGGWPLNMFLTPDGRPFTGGTYFPPDQRYGRNSFRDVLGKILNYWQNERESIFENAGKITDYLKQKAQIQSPDHLEADDNLYQRVYQSFSNQFDEKEGGFSFQAQNKFPPSMGLMFLLRYYQSTGEEKALQMAELTLKKMLAGGIYDQIGGGLCRYSTDHQWLVPHFEKMLYDNALLVWALIETFQITKDPFYRSAIEDVLAYLERDLYQDGGGFYSAEDADSEGVEGKFYVWTINEVKDILGEVLAEKAAEYWGISANGNFESSRNILFRTDVSGVIEKNSDLELARQKLFDARKKRIRPLLDDIILVSWNALAISAFARAAKVLENDKYARIARSAAEFIFGNMILADHSLMRRYRDGEAKFKGYLNDYAQLALACIDLYEVDYELQWLKRAKSLMDQVDKRFFNDSGPYFLTDGATERLLVRNVEAYDGVEPSGNSSAALAFLKLDAYGFGGPYRKNAERILSGFREHMTQAGSSFAAMLWAYGWATGTPNEIVIVGERSEPLTEKLLAVVRKEYLPNAVILFLPADNLNLNTNFVPLAEGRQQVENQATAYVCQNQTCQMPVHDTTALRAQLEL